MRKWSSTLIVSAIILIIAAIAYKDAISESFFQGISFYSLILTLFKSIIVILIISIAVPVGIVALLIDIILWLTTDYYFPLIDYIFDLVWGRITISWFWNLSNGNEIFLSALIIGILGLIGQRSKKRRRKY